MGEVFGERQQGPCRLFPPFVTLWEDFRRRAVAILALICACLFVLFLFQGAPSYEELRDLSVTWSEFLEISLSLLLLAPVLETILLAGLLVILRRVRISDETSCLIAGLIFGYLHWRTELGNLAIPSALLWFVIFCIFADAFWAWRPLGMGRSIVFVAALHSIANMVGVALFASANLILMGLQKS